MIRVLKSFTFSPGSAVAKEIATACSEKLVVVRAESGCASGMLPSVDQGWDRISRASLQSLAELGCDCLQYRFDALEVTHTLLPCLFPTAVAW